MKKYLIITLLFLTGCNTYKSVNERNVLIATIVLDHSVAYVNDEVENGNIEIFTGMSLLEDFLMIKNHLLEDIKKQKMAKTMVHKLANVKIKGDDGELKHIIVEANLTSEIRTILDDNGYDNFKIINWELIEADEILVKSPIEEK